MQAQLNQVMNPTKEERHEMIMTSLINQRRPEDYDYITNLLSPPPDITDYASPGELKGIKIGIIGGGLAGMSAAYELRKLGAEITIFDANEARIGGRVYTYYFDPGGQFYGELGASRIPASHETTWHYINQLGLDTLSMSAPGRNNFLYAHNTRLRTSDSIEQYLYPLYELTEKERATPWNELSSYATFQPLLQLTPEIRSELIRIQPNYSPEILPMMNHSLRSYLEKLGLSQGFINLMSGVQPGNGALLHISYDEIVRDEYTLDNLNTYRIIGGNSNLPYAFYQSFLADDVPGYQNYQPADLGIVDYKFGHYVAGIYQSDYRNKVILKYKDTVEEKENADVFDYVICALPFSSLRNVEIKPYFSNMKMQAILELNYIDAQKTLFLCNRRFWERNTDYGNITGGISLTDLPIQSILYPNDHALCLPAGTCSPEEPGVLTASYNFEQNATRLGGQEDRKRYQIIRRNAEEVHGLPRGFLNSIVERYKTVHWNSEPNFMGALVQYLPEQKPFFAYQNLQPEYHNRVFFAGEHVSTKHGWMQGALQTGKASANQLAYSYHNRVK